MEEVEESNASVWYVVLLVLIGEAVMVEQIVEALLLTVKILILTVVGIVKALLPVGILPRKNVRGQNVLITGSGSGLGRMMAKEFGKLGATIILWDVNEKGNKETQSQLEAIGVKAHAYTVNLAKKEEIYETAKKVKSEVGDVDILINNAGIVTGKKLFDCPDELMELTMAVNCNALLFTSKAFVPTMLEKNHGHVVTIASMAGQTGVAGLVDYCASKHAAVGFHESLTAEVASLKKSGVHTTVVCPFYIDTGMFDGVQTKSPNLLPILDPQLVIDRIMEAVLTNQTLVAIPRFCYLVMFFASFAPANVIALMSDYFGVNETMDHFKGRAKAH